MTAPTTATFGEDIYTFNHWSDGGARNHAALVNTGATHLTATYTKTAGDASNTCSGASTVTPSGAWRTGRLSTATDVDWYRFSLTSTSTRPHPARQPARGRQPEPVQRLHQAAGHLGPRGTSTEEIFKSLAKGSYAVKVTTKGVASTDLYSLNIRKMAGRAQPGDELRPAWTGRR